jgi:glycosyltransferase involved in cell wall biosynthesis
MQPAHKILFVCPDTPCPVGTGARVRNWHLLRAAAAQYAVSLVLLNNDGLEMDKELGRLCANVIRPVGNAAPTHKRSRLQSLLKTVGVLAFPWQNDWETLTLYAAQHSDRLGRNETKLSTRLLAAQLLREYRLAARGWALPPALTVYLRDAARRLPDNTMKQLAQENFDVLWTKHSYCYPVARKLLPSDQRPLLVCDAHNVESALQRRCVVFARSPAEAGWFSLQSDLLKQIETDAFQSCDLTLACSDEDKSLIGRLAPRANLMTVPNGVDINYFRPRADSIPATNPTLLFTGNFAYQPNADALTWFVTEIFPHVTKSAPTCRLVFAGLGAQAVFDQLPINRENISCVSNPADIRPCFDRPWIFVVPLRAGGGTRLKILEAMAMERPIVSTRIGAEGIPCKDGEHILLADSPGDFANAVLRLIRNETLRFQLASHAALWVRRNYNWGDLCGSAVDAVRQRLNAQTNRGALKTIAA